MADELSQPEPQPDPADVSLEFVERHGLLDAAARGVHRWDVHITAGSDTGTGGTGLLRASRACFYRVGNLRARMEDESPFMARVASAVLTPDGEYVDDFEAAVEMPVGDLLVIEALSLPLSHADPLLAAGVVAAVVDRLAGGCCAILFPREEATEAESKLLGEACQLLDVDDYGEDFMIADPALIPFDKAAAQVRERLHRRSLTGRDGHRWEYDDLEDDEEDRGWELTGRTAAVLRLALQELSEQAWQELAALDDEPLSARAAGVFADLPRITFRQPRAWRRQMARCFDDLAEDIKTGEWPRPRCTGEEMALHLAIARAASLIKDRPRRVADAVAEHPRHEDDFDWDGCSDLLFEDHDVLMLFDDALDGIEDSNNELNQYMGMANLAAADWFDPFREGRDPDRGFRQP